MKECEKLKKEYLEGWKRAQADLINYKKQESARLCEFSDYIREEFILKLLPVLDNMYLAEKKAPKDEWAKGVLKIKEQFLSFLENQGVEEIKTEGKLDLNLHEVAEEEKREGLEPGLIIEVKRRGYKFKDKVIRPSKVKISK